MNSRIKQIRQHPNIDLSQEAFGKRLGITGAAISRLESGDRNITDQIMRAICREFNVSEDWMRTGKGEMFLELSEDAEFVKLMVEIQVSNDDFIKSLLSSYWSLTDSEKAAIHKLVDGIIKKKAGE